jgi:predicted kinase
MATLVICRGLPASGKSTFAKNWVREDPTKRVRLNRDDLRASLHGGYIGQAGEIRVTKLQQTMAAEYLKTGTDVITDDTNLNAGFVKEWLKTAAKVGADVEWHEEFLDIELPVLLARDHNRRVTGDAVGEKVIKDFYGRYLSSGRTLKRPELSAEAVVIHAQYEGTPGKPKAFLVDLDGTIADFHTSNHRGPHDYHKVSGDAPVTKIIELVRYLEIQGLLAIYVSGRKDSCYNDSVDWIQHHVYGPYVPLTGEVTLLMRKTEDDRKDSIVKLEIFDEHIRDNYDVQFCIDDRNQVVKAYRSIGLTVLQVQDGDF